MWVIALFDLPVVTKEERKRAVKFRTALLKAGFRMLQFSVYARHCASRDVVDRHLRAIRREIPPAGQVRLIAITDRQFGAMEVHVGRKRVDPEGTPDQLVLF